MRMRTFVWFLVVAVVIVIVALALHGHADGGLGDWFRRMHGR